MCKDSNGFTLIEFLVSIVILMVGLLGLLQTVNVAIQHNMQNQYRNEATILADREIATEIAKGYDAVQTTASSSFAARSYDSGFALRNYSTLRSGTSYNNSKEVNYRITWRYKGVKYEHTISSVISKTNQ